MFFGVIPGSGARRPTCRVRTTVSIQHLLEAVDKPITPDELFNLVAGDAGHDEFMVVLAACIQRGDLQWNGTHVQRITEGMRYYDPRRI